MCWNVLIESGGRGTSFFLFWPSSVNKLNPFTILRSESPRRRLFNHVSRWTFSLLLRARRGNKGSCRCFSEWFMTWRQDEWLLGMQGHVCELLRCSDHYCENKADTCVCARSFITSSYTYKCSNPSSDTWNRKTSHCHNSLKSNTGKSKYKRNFWRNKYKFVKLEVTANCC